MRYPADWRIFITTGEFTVIFTNKKGLQCTALCICSKENICKLSENLILIICVYYSQRIRLRNNKKYFYQLQRLNYFCLNITHVTWKQFKKKNLSTLGIGITIIRIKGCLTFIIGIHILVGYHLYYIYNTKKTKKLMGKSAVIRYELTPWLPAVQFFTTENKFVAALINRY